MLLTDYLTRLGWDKAELARQAGVDPHTAGRAVDGDTISSRSARKIAAAISQATGTTVHVGDIRGIYIKG